MEGNSEFRHGLEGGGEFLVKGEVEEL